MIFVIIRLITQLINQLRKKEIIWFLSKQIILQCARILRSNCALIIKSTKNYRPGGTYWDGGDLYLFQSRGQIVPTLIWKCSARLEFKKIKALISFDRRLILKTFSAELHKATTELLGYQWLIIYMLSLGLVLSTKILKNNSKLEYFSKISAYSTQKAHFWPK